MRSDQSCHVRLAILILATLSSLFATIGFLSYAGLLPSTLPFGSRLRDSSDSYLFLQLEKGSKNVFFKEHDSYKDLSHDSDHLWNEQITPNGGFLKVVQGDSEARDYGIAMFHQLHCVAMIREEMQMLHRMINPLGRKHEHASSNNATLKHDSKHVMHCFDYLRQSLLCLADGTIEPPKNTNGTVDGMIQRKCKDWAILYKASRQSDINPVAREDLK